MVKNHLKRIAAPKTWHLARKKSKFITRPNPGAHSLQYSMPLTIYLRDVVKVAKTAREVKHILNHSIVLVDGKRRKDPRFSIGLMDVLSFPETKQNFRVTLDAKGRLGSVEISEKEANTKISQVKTIKVVKGGKLRVGLSDGRNFGIDKQDYSIGDVVLLEVPSQKVVKHFTYGAKKPVMLIGGKHAGKTGVIDHVEGDIIIFEYDGQKHETKRKYAFLTGDKEAEVTL